MYISGPISSALKGFFVLFVIRSLGYIAYAAVWTTTKDDEDPAEVSG